ncbi:hypothetical protein HGRIS_014469 [Hohenbuehelia grisea]|uniref:Uncharacterized protein n=1 Tax=Hohenbuehelia grisea TaxID=104357 RepID=A0ABR3JVQ0_9AGAR
MWRDDLAKVDMRPEDDQEITLARLLEPITPSHNRTLLYSEIDPTSVNDYLASGGPPQLISDLLEALGRGNDGDGSNTTASESGLSASDFFPGLLTEGLPPPGPSNNTFPGSGFVLGASDDLTAPFPTPKPAATDSQTEKCGGVLCRTRSPRSKLAKTCTYRLCKKCCQQHQASSSVRCSLKPHKIESPPDPTSSTQPSITNLVDEPGFYDRTKPLAKEHYDTKARAQESGRTLLARVTERTKLEEAVQKSVNICFIRTNDAPSEVFEGVLCPNYPLFKLSSCSTDVLSWLGLGGSARTIQVFNPADDPPRWVINSIDSVRVLEDKPSVLYRAVGVSQGPDMLQLQEKHIGKKAFRTRPVDITTITSTLPASAPSQNTLKRRAPSSEYLQDTDPRPLRRTRISSSSPQSVNHREDSSIDIDLLDSPTASPRSSPSPRLAKLDRDQTSGSERLPLVLPTRSPESTSTGLVTTRLSADEACVIILPPSEIDPASAKGPFPLKYAFAMIEGFDKMQSMTGPIPAKFVIAFPTAGHFLKTSFHEHFPYYQSASPALRSRFVSAKYSALWAEFRAAVRKERLAEGLPEYPRGRQAKR